VCSCAKVRSAISRAAGGGAAQHDEIGLPEVKRHCASWSRRKARANLVEEKRRPQDHKLNLCQNARMCCRTFPSAGRPSSLLTSRSARSSAAYLHGTSSNSPRARDDSGMRCFAADSLFEAEADRV